MFEKRAKYLYSVKEILQENVNDFDIMREKPITFRAGGQFLVCCPIRYYEHPRFLNDMTMLLVKYSEIFSKAQFLNSKEFRRKTQIERAVATVTLFSHKKYYKNFIRKEIHNFIRKWSFAIKNEKLVKISRWKAKKFLSAFSVDEILQIFFTIYVFNFDIVKKKTSEFLSQIILPESQQNTTISNITTKSSAPKIPRYSAKPMRKSDLDSLDQMRTEH